MEENNTIRRRFGNNYLGRSKKAWTCIKNGSAWEGHIRLWGQLSTVGDYYKIVGHVLIEEAKSTV